MSSLKKPDSYGEPSGPSSTVARGVAFGREMGNEGNASTRNMPLATRSEGWEGSRRGSARGAHSPASSSVSFDSLGQTETPGGGSFSSIASSFPRRAACAIVGAFRPTSMAAMRFSTAIVASAASVASAAGRNPILRTSFRYFERLSTRVNDNDAFGHINDVVYYSFMNNAVNAQLIRCHASTLRPSPIHSRSTWASACPSWAPPL